MRTQQVPCAVRAGSVRSPSRFCAKSVAKFGLSFHFWMFFCRFLFNIHDIKNGARFDLVTVRVTSHWPCLRPQFKTPTRPKPHWPWFRPQFKTLTRLTSHWPWFRPQFKTPTRLTSHRPWPRLKSSWAVGESRDLESAQRRVWSVLFYKKKTEQVPCAVRAGSVRSPSMFWKSKTDKIESKSTIFKDLL